MKIGIDASRANHTEKTGVEWYAFFLIQALKAEIKNQKSKVKNGEEIEVVLYSDDPLQGELANLPKNWTSKVLRWPPKRLWTQIRLSLEMLVSPPDVLFVPAHTFPLIHPQKTVMTVHDIAAVRFPKSYSVFEAWYSLWSAKVASRTLWRVIVPSAFTKRELQAVFLKNTDSDRAEKIQVIPHGFDPAFSVAGEALSDEKIVQKYNLRTPFILSVSRLEEKKNTARLLQAFAWLKTHYDLPDLRLVLVGKPGFGFEAVEKELATELSGQSVDVLGWIAQADLPALQRMASVCVLPSLYEGFGLPVLEALAAGTPVVASRSGSLPEVGGDCVLYVDPDSVESIGRGMYQAVYDEQWRNHVQPQGKVWAEQFSWQKSAQETWQVLLS